MADLHARTPLAGVPAFSAGTCQLTEADLGPITSIAPFRGLEKSLSAALKSAHGVVFPAPNRVSVKGAARMVWTGRDQAFLIGVAPDAGLAVHAALCDQSDGWAALRLHGDGCADVLARLTPLDLSLTSFAAGHCARSALQHVMAILIRPEATLFEILVMRSFAATAWHDLTEAMRSVAARDSPGS